MTRLQTPLLPSHYSVWVDPPDEAGDEVLHVVSERRTLKLKGQYFREFRDRVVPLLDGRHTVAEIQAATDDVFRPQDLADALDLLAAQGVLVEAPAGLGDPGAGAGLDDDTLGRTAPQVNLFHDLAPGVAVHERLARATVSVVGLGGAGPACALALAAAGVGTLRLTDAEAIGPADVYLSPFLGLGRIGVGRAEATAESVRAAAPQVKVDVVARPLASEDDVGEAVGGADVVVGCLDASQANLTFKLNRVCLAARIPWLSCSPAGAEVVVGPAVDPGHSACYLCYRMRAVACAANPEEAFAHERWLDARKRDEGATRENLVFGVGIAANVAGLEIVKMLTGVGEPSLVGRILTVRLTDLTTERHAVLRKPWCPACFPPTGAHADEG